jgi:hypothetical protein
VRPPPANPAELTQFENVQKKRKVTRLETKIINRSIHQAIKFKAHNSAIHSFSHVMTDNNTHPGKSPAFTNAAEGSAPLSFAAPSPDAPDAPANSSAPAIVDARDGSTMSGSGSHRSGGKR